jgi:hypothetical protein
MNRHKEAFIRAHEELIAEHMDRYGTDWTTAYERTGDDAYAKMADDYAAQLDMLRDELREKGK